MYESVTLNLPSRSITVLTNRNETIAENLVEDEVTITNENQELRASEWTDVVRNKKQSRREIDSKNEIKANGRSAKCYTGKCDRNTNAESLKKFIEQIVK